jgi:hypothetical protein
MIHVPFSLGAPSGAAISLTHAEQRPTIAVIRSPKIRDSLIL